MSEFYIDPKSLYDEELDSFTDLWDDYSTLWGNFQNILDRSVVLPHHAIQAPLVIAYSLSNQKWAKTLPLLFLYGKEGSAKSQIIKLNRHLHDSTIYGADCTFASTRNELNRMKWLDYEEDRTMHRDGAMLLFDNVYPQTFLNDEKLLSMMLRSYEDSNDTVSIAAAMGENYSFRTFTAKMISSVQPFSSIHQLRELNRRMITIRTKPLKEMTEDELSHRIDGEVLDLDSVNFDGLNFKYVQFWNDASNCARYVQLRKQLTRANGTAQKYLKNAVTEEKSKILVDLIVTSVVTGGYTSLEASIDAMAEHFELNTRLMAKDTPASVEVFKNFIDDWLSLKGTADCSIPTSEIKAIADDLNLNWKSERRLGQKEISEVMNEIGWSLDGKRSAWVKTVQ